MLVLCLVVVYRCFRWLGWWFVFRFLLVGCRLGIV